MKHNVLDWLAAWVLAITMIAAIAVVGLPSHRSHEIRYLDVSRSRLLLADPSDSGMFVDRDEPLADKFDATAPVMPDLTPDQQAVHPAC